VTQVRNLPPEWEALFKGLNDTLKSLGAHGVTRKEAQMLFAMASDALVPVPSTPATAAAPASAFLCAQTHGQQTHTTRRSQ
jgi:hypothetical protein